MCLELEHLSRCLLLIISTYYGLRERRTPVAADIIIHSYKPLIFYLNALVACSL